VALADFPQLAHTFSGTTMIPPSVHITFGMIVLNGEPFTRYCLRSIYPWAHQIIVVEGACQAAEAVADGRGHSTDGTLEVLLRFQAKEDPDRKLILVTAEDEGHPDGFWPGEKNEMSQAYAKRASGQYLWQVDSDEFYREEDMPAILGLLQQGADAITFPTLQFWGGIQFVEDGEYMRVHKGSEFHRLFRWGAGFRYTTHRPPTVVNAQGTDVRQQHWVTAAQLKARQVFLYHYSKLLPKQVLEKSSYYARVDWAAFQRMESWAQETFFQLKHPFRVCNTLHMPLSWLEEYRGTHPKQILEMIANIQAGQHPNIELRPIADIVRVIRAPQYRVGRWLQKVWVAFLPLRNAVWSWLARWKLLGRLRRRLFGMRNNDLSD